MLRLFQTYLCQDCISNSRNAAFSIPRFKKKKGRRAAL